ncbi:MAG: thiol-disulfide oxidoreductase DCC family protein [Phycisphaerae bacterium]
MPDSPTDIASQMSSRQPVLLFDGVCNLCNSSVRWIIARDHSAKIRFTSLQSPAARELLASRGVSDLPDSMVLLDDAGTHTRSTAAIRVARLLGFPWSLAIMAMIIPRFMRDALYDWIARNRYRWFGRQNACMVPTPELRARFLDGSSCTAAEITTSATADASSLLPRTISTVVGGWIQRFFLVYLILYCLPFPLNHLPAGYRLSGQYHEAQRGVVVWVAENVFDKTITIFPGGSGDTTYNYVEFATMAATALAVSTLWTLAALGHAVRSRMHAFANIYLRYCLAATLLGYGFAKLMPVQMPFPGPDRLLNSFADTSPMGLLWTFIGASPAYQMFAGAGEVLGGLLLLWRRTALLGALVSAGVMTNVVALNFCYDVPVKLYSSHLLLISLFLIAPHAMRLAAVLVLNLPAQPVELRPFGLRNRWLRGCEVGVKLLVLSFLILPPIRMNYQYLTTNGGLLAPSKPWHGIYVVESFTRDGVADREVADADRWVRVGLNSAGVGSIQRATGEARRRGMRWNEGNGTLAWLPGDQKWHDLLQWSMPEPGVIVLVGRFEGAHITARLRRVDDSGSLLTSRGFHWINEYPLNR